MFLYRLLYEINIIYWPIKRLYVIYDINKNDKEISIKLMSLILFPILWYRLSGILRKKRPKYKLFIIIKTYYFARKIILIINALFLMILKIYLIAFLINIVDYFILIIFIFHIYIWNPYCESFEETKNILLRIYKKYFVNFIYKCILFESQMAWTIQRQIILP